MYEVIVGIDFGSANSGFAYSFNDKNNINHGHIHGANVDNKVPTEIILDDNNDVVQFGKGCVQYLKEKGLQTGHYFKDIKMLLYEKQKIIKAKNTGKELPLQLVIQKVLEKIKELAIEEIGKNRPHLKEKKEKIKWVVTVPAIWSEYEKNMMMEACIKAGLIKENDDKSLFFALEPEAASLYCSINKDIDHKYFNTGEYYIVCDLGGGTGDIVAHLVGSNNYLNEIHPACGGKYGSNEIDKLIFEEIILLLFGCKDFNSFYKKYKRNNKEGIIDDEGELFNDWSELEREIRDFKEGTTIKKVEDNEKYPINFTLFKDIFDEDVEINDLINEYNDNIYEKELYLTSKKSRNKWIIEFPYKIVYKYIQNQANSICQIIKNILAKENIKTIILVGGYCYNEVIIESIKKGLNNSLIYLQPTRPCLSIMEGAVLFGIEPSTINIRKAKYTIGTNINNPWDNKIHSERGIKVFSENFNEWMCKNCFDKFIEINQSIKLDEKITKNSYMAGKRYCTINFYKTMKCNPTFAFEEGMTFIGKCKLDAGKEFEKLEDKKFKTTMKFGGTFIDVSAKHLKSGNLVKTKLIFN